MITYITDWRENLVGRGNDEDLVEFLNEQVTGAAAGFGRQRRPSSKSIGRCRERKNESVAV